MEAEEVEVEDITNNHLSSRRLKTMDITEAMLPVEVEVRVRVASRVKYFPVPKCTWGASSDPRESQLTTCRRNLDVIFRSIKMYLLDKIVRLISREPGRALIPRSKC